MSNQTVIETSQLDEMRQTIVDLSLAVLRTWTGGEPTDAHRLAFLRACEYGGDSEITEACSIVARIMLGGDFTFTEGGEIAEGPLGQIDLTLEWPAFIPGWTSVTA